METSTLSLHDALPISDFPQANTVTLLDPSAAAASPPASSHSDPRTSASGAPPTTSARAHVLCIVLVSMRSEEHTSELQSQFQLVCRLLLEKTNYGLAV